VDQELGLNPFEQPLSLVDDIPKEVWETDRDAEREKRFNKYSSSIDNIKQIQGTINGPSKAVTYMIKWYFELYMYY
jgi:hypothetical protein